MEILICVLILHWAGDFLCQTSWMAINKSKSWVALAVHVAVYTTVLTLCLPFMVNVDSQKLVWFGTINGAIHLIIDAITSRWNAFFQKKNWIWPFWGSIGFDQLLHNITLIVSVHYLFLL